MGSSSSKENALISVIIPVYNTKPYLKEAINSIIAQTYSNLEIILVDDGSTDGSGSICDKYQSIDTRVIVIHQENSGLSAARNAGLDICTGEMISFLDSDDAYCPDMLSTMYSVMQKSGADIVECNCSLYYSSTIMDPDKIDQMPRFFRDNDRSEGTYSIKYTMRMQVQRKIAANAWNKLYRREVWQDLRFIKGHNYEDLSIILPIIEKASKVHIINTPLIMHRKRNGSITKTHTITNLEDRLLSYDSYLAYIKQHTPEIFKQEDIITVQKRLYTILLNLYCDSSLKCIRDKKNYLTHLQAAIYKTKVKIDIHSCNLRLRLMTFIMSCTPPLLCGIIYRIFRLCHHFALKVLLK